MLVTIFFLEDFVTFLVFASLNIMWGFSSYTKYVCRSKNYQRYEDQET